MKCWTQNIFLALAIVSSAYAEEVVEKKPIKDEPIAVFSPKALEKNTEGFSVDEIGKTIQLHTPYGEKVLWGDFDLQRSSNYKLEIPLELIDPAYKKKLLEKQGIKDVSNSESNTNSTNSTNSTTNNTINTEIIRNPATGLGINSQPTIVKYDESDRLVLEANRLYNRGKFYEASMVVEELLRRSPEHVRGWVMKGSLMHVQGQKDMAKNAWQKALVLDPNNGTVKNLLEKY